MFSTTFHFDLVRRSEEWIPGAGRPGVEDAGFDAGGSPGFVDGYMVLWYLLQGLRHTSHKDP